MLRLWLCGVAISTVAASAIFTEEAGCVGRCPPLSVVYDPIRYLRHNDCNKYCVCVSGRPEVHQCDVPGEYWSEAQELCTDPAEAKCQALTYHEPSNSTITEHGVSRVAKPRIKAYTGFEAVCNNNSACECIGQCPKLEHSLHVVLLAHRDCKKYCHCQKGRPVVRNCRPNYQFNLERLKCLRQEQANCDRVSGYTTTVAPPSDNTIRKGCKTRCPKYYNALIPHKSCSKYCRCRGGGVSVRVCPNNLYFSTKYAKCIPQNKSKCRDSTTTMTSWITSSTLPTTSEISLSTESSLTPATILLEDVNDCVGNCSEKDSNHYELYTHLPHRECKKYCECYQGNLTVKECSYGYYFDMLFQMCIFPLIVKCYSDSDIVTFTSTALPFLSSFSLPTESSSTSIVKLPDDVNDCKKNDIWIDVLDNKTYYKIPHKDCNKYCEYHNGNLTVKKCQYDFHFDMFFRTCDLPQFSQCDNKSDIATSISSNSSTNSSFFSSSSLPTESPPTSVVELSESVEDCIGGCPLIDHLNYIRLLAHKQCEKYCECRNGTRIVKSCSPNSHFNWFLEICDQPEFAGCRDINDIITSSTVLSIEPHSTSAVTSSLSSSSSSSTEIVPTIATRPPENVEGCIGKCPYINDLTRMTLLPHQHCEKYCLCYWGRPVLMSCGPNTHFNPTLQVCDYIKNAGCRGITDSCLPTEPPPGSIIIYASMDTKKCICTNEDEITYAECCAKYPQNNPLTFSVLLEIGGLKNGSEIDLYLDDPNISISVQNDSNNDNNTVINFEETRSIVKKNVKEEKRYSKKSNGLVVILANLWDKEQCIGTCPKSILGMSTIYLPHKNCRRACKCSFGRSYVMQCQDNFYWNAETEECDSIFNVECHNVGLKSASEENGLSFFDAVKKIFDANESSLHESNDSVEE